MTNEPTTGEIVSALRNCPNCDDCLRKDQKCYRNDHDAADRLESQERELSGITGELERFRAFHERYAEQTSKKYVDDICALTARAESAEAERDAAIGHVHDAIFGTNHSCFYCTMENCHGCTNSTVKEHFKYRALKPNKYLTIQDERGLPQEGEGV